MVNEMRGSFFLAHPLNWVRKFRCVFPYSWRRVGPEPSSGFSPFFEARGAGRSAHRAASSPEWRPSPEEGPGAAAEVGGAGADAAGVQGPVPRGTAAGLGGPSRALAAECCVLFGVGTPLFGGFKGKQIRKTTSCF